MDWILWIKGVSTYGWDSVLHKHKFSKHAIWDRCDPNQCHTRNTIKSTHLFQLCPYTWKPFPCQPHIHCHLTKQVGEKSRIRMKLLLSLIFVVVALFATCQACSTTPLSAAGISNHFLWKRCLGQNLLMFLWTFALSLSSCLARHQLVVCFLRLISVFISCIDVFVCTYLCAYLYLSSQAALGLEDAQGAVLPPV